jgi:hypothetical protein
VLKTAWRLLSRQLVAIDGERVSGASAALDILQACGPAAASAVLS